MAFYTYAVNETGCFKEKSGGKYFGYSKNDNPYGVSNVDDFPHKIWVGDVIFQNFRYAKVLKTVAYVVTDEDASGNPVTEKWNISQQREY